MWYEVITTRERWNYEEITLHKKWQGGCKLLTSILTFSEKLKKLQKHFHVPFQIHIISPTLSIFTQIFIPSIWGWVDDDDENKNLIIKMRRKIIEFFPIDIEALFFFKRNPLDAQLNYLSTDNSFFSFEIYSTVKNLNKNKFLNLHPTQALFRSD